MDMKYGCKFHPICHSCLNQWRKSCWEMPHRFLFCPYCRDILLHAKDDRDVFINCTDCDRKIVVHKKRCFTNKKEFNKMIFDKSLKFQDLILKDIRYLY